MPLFLNQTKSLIARNLFDNNTFWQVANEANDSYKKALAVINTNQFDILNPSKKEIKKAEKEYKQKSEAIKKKEAIK